MNTVGTQTVFPNPFSEKFMNAHTDFPTLQALFTSLRKSLHRGHRLIQRWELDLYIQNKTPFSSWNDMMNNAIEFNKISFRRD